MNYIIRLETGGIGHLRADVIKEPQRNRAGKAR